MTNQLNTLTSQSPTQILQYYWRYNSFRTQQLEIINSILTMPEVMTIMPTGGGKSICFQVPALMLPGLTIVISPLISLMKDQVDALMCRGIPAAHLSSSQTPIEQSAIYTKIQNQELKLLYVSPERLQSKRFQTTIRTISISLIVIDEAHCISEWGHDFRPEYRQIPSLIQYFQTKPKIAAFTATATPEVQQDIIKSLNLQNPKCFIGSFERDNLAIEVNYCPSIFSQQLTLLRLVKKYQNQSGIVYVSSRNTAESLVKLIHSFYPHLAIDFYHAGLESKQRDLVQEAFIKDKLKIIIATNAFGMGIDKSAIRFVVHYQIPSSLEHYYQEIGRAGRDRLPSNTTLLFNPMNLQIHLKLFNKSSSLNTEYLKLQIQKLDAIRQFARTKKCRSKLIMRYFGEYTKDDCGRCDNCRNVPLMHPLLQQIEEEDHHQLKHLFEARKLLAKHWSVSPTDVAHPQILCQLALVDNYQDEQQILSLAGVGEGWFQSWWPYLKNQLITNQLNFQNT